MRAWSPSELHKRYKTGVTREPLALAVNNQPVNGGIAVDVWGRSSLADCYAAGEAAGTHGVTRPGARKTANGRSPRAAPAKASPASSAPSAAATAR